MGISPFNIVLFSSSGALFVLYAIGTWQDIQDQKQRLRERAPTLETSASSARVRAIAERLGVTEAEAINRAVFRLYRDLADHDADYDVPGKAAIEKLEQRPRAVQSHPKQPGD